MQNATGAVAPIDCELVCSCVSVPAKQAVQREKERERNNESEQQTLEEGLRWNTQYETAGLSPRDTHVQKHTITVSVYSEFVVGVGN